MASVGPVVTHVSVAASFTVTVAPARPDTPPVAPSNAVPAMLFAAWFSVALNVFTVPSATPKTVAVSSL